jgi:DedD protein
MGLFSFLRKNKQESKSGNSDFYSRAEDEPPVARGRGKRKQGKQGDDPVDPVLPEKKRARRRLVGAIALVLAVIIGLPMILDSEPKPLATDIAIQIPSKDKPLSLPADNQADTSSAAKVGAAAALDQDEEVIEAPATVATINDKFSDDVKPSEPEKPPVAEKTAIPSPPVDKPEPKAVVKSPSSGKTDEEVRALAILEGKTAVAHANGANGKSSGKFVIQVAALASKEKVNELQGKLKDAGIKSYTQKVATESGERIRIRIGPFASKEEADKTRAKLGKLGLNGTLVPA